MFLKSGGLFHLPHLVFFLVLYYKPYPVEQFARYFNNSFVLFHSLAKISEGHGHCRVFSYGHPACLDQFLLKTFVPPVGKAKHMLFLTAASYFGHQANIVA